MTAPLLRNSSSPILILNENKNEEENFTINFFGVGCKIVKASIDEPLLTKINECTTILKSSFSNAVFYKFR